MATKKKAPAGKNRPKSAAGKAPAREDARRSTAAEKLQFPHGQTLNDKEGRPQEAPEAERDYYKLKLQAVDDLVTASPENSPPVPKKELRKYHAGPKVKVADWIKAILIKIWFAGVICYFFVWGLSTFTLNQWDLLVILGVALGGVTHLLTNNLFRFAAKQKGAYDRWMMFPGNSLAWLPLDILYALVLVVCTVMTYNGINLAAAGGAKDAAPLVGVEPILFGIIITLWDLLFLGAKQLMKRILSDAKQKVSAK